ncbi:MFS transporter [Pseudonocardia sp. HH130630-07]|uniref:MFS transporter n=1 Tax=Pseudonocardia sp. HH130630-07 TaxID=1690815 RepID=UPI000815160C|nr:MFS transporter [Pseudonocardia sp. HH130630-07]ANY09882.1 MFS transporter [Pseudonocardia sp. HH130630-07]
MARPDLTTPGTTPDPKETRRVAAATLIGTSIEWFDFFVYGAAAALVFGKLFFPTADPLTGTLLALSTFGVGFVARPFGGVIFAHYGDRIGRKSMLVLSVLLMGGGTFVVGLLPTYETIGVAAPVLLVLLRIVQGIGLGGEWGAAAVMAVEFAPPHRRGFFGSFPQMGVPAGMLTANLSLLVMSSVMSEDAFLAWGWRVPFLASIVLVVLGIVIRLKVHESPVFTAAKAAGRIERTPVLAVFRRQPVNVLRAAGLRFAENSTFYIHTTFVLTYGTVALGMARGDLLLAVIVSSAVGLVSIPFYGWACDRWGRRRVVLWGSFVLLAMSWPYFWALDTRSLPLIVLATVVAVNVGNSAVYAPQPAYFSELFEPEVRYSGASIGAQGASVLAGGLAPVIATALLDATGGYDAIALYMSAMVLITIVAAALSPDRYRESLARRQAESAREPV